MDTTTGMVGNTAQVSEPASDAALAVSEKKGGTASKQKQTWALPFAKLEISTWNRSKGVKLDEGYIKSLAANIKQHGLLHPVTIVRNKGSDGNGPDYLILAGAHRVAALRMLRGVDAGLLSNEFVIRDGIDEGSPKCLEIAVAENSLRRDSSPAELARYVMRMMDDCGVDQKRLAKVLGLRREVVNRLVKLAKHLDQLSAAWQADLNRSASRGGEGAPTIGIGHWTEIAGKIGDDGVPAELVPILARAQSEGWTTAQLRKAVAQAGKQPPDEGQAKKEPKGAAGKPTGKPNVLQIMEAAERHLRQAAAMLEPLMKDQAAEMLRFAETLKLVIGRVMATKAETAAKTEAERQQKKLQAVAAKKQKTQKATGTAGKKSPVGSALLAAMTSK